MTTTPAPFSALRVDSQKADGGVWITHPDTRDQLRIRRRLRDHHLAAWRAAAADYESRHGEGSMKTPEAELEVDAIALATGVVVDWKLAGDDRPYDAGLMAAALSDPELPELRAWVVRQSDDRANFRPEAK